MDGASGRYGRLFTELPTLAGEDDALLALGRAGGVCDGGDSCTDAIETAAGWPLFGQFIAHDITADRSSYLTSKPAWTPTLPARGERFGLTDLLLAGA
jgi:hypothetical protein